MDISKPVPISYEKAFNNINSIFHQINPFNPFIPVNHLVNLIRRTTYLLDRQMQALERKFIQEGGYTEKLFHRRLSHRRNMVQ